MEQAMLDIEKIVNGMVGYSDSEKKEMIECRKEDLIKRNKLLQSVTQFMDSLDLEYEANYCEIKCNNKGTEFQIWFYPDRIILVDKSRRLIRYFGGPYDYNEVSILKLLCVGLLL